MIPPYPATLYFHFLSSLSALCQHIMFPHFFYLIADVSSNPFLRSKSPPLLPPTTISLAWSCLTALALERRRRASKPRSLCTTQFCEFSTHANEHCLGNTPSTTPHLVCQSTALLLCWCGGANVCCSLFDLLLLLSVTLCVQI